MWKRWKRFEEAAFLRVWRRPSEGKVERRAWRLLLITLVSVLLWLILPRWINWLPGIVFWVFFPLFFVFATVVSIRWVLQRVLWTVRSRLIVTCLLMGLAPIVLFGTLTAFAAYLFCGQFATIVAIEQIKDGAANLQQTSREILARLSAPGGAAQAGEPLTEGVFSLTWRDGALLPASSANSHAAAFAGPLPSWVHPGFSGQVGAAGKLFLCGTAGRTVAGHTWFVLTCSPLGDAELATFAERLGHLSITPNFSSQTLQPKAGGAAHHTDDDDKDDDADTGDGRDHRDTWVQGGVLPPRVNLLDVRVYFSAPATTLSWMTGESLDTFVNVISRPTILYHVLFYSSVHAGRYVWIALIFVAGLFALLELAAVALAALVSWTITRSISDLYLATQEIDRGNLNHLIPVRRKDQLSSLAASFNGMTRSLRLLLEEQREKDRMQNELKIAQEVQNNLFPHTTITVPRLEVYGICEPARTIGGDYYDFIPFGGSQLYLSLGDISGKGISAALLMASLHSAVRAFRAGDQDELIDFEASLTPGKLLGLLNRHLYTSTQPAKYATLFLASYDAVTQRLTYSNGGHPPPVLLRSDGSLKRLECGGSVVGLLDGMIYEEETVELQAGDLLVAYSDGLSEPEKDGVEFGESGVIEIVQRNKILNLDQIASRTIKAVRDWFGDEEQPDDMTIVLVRVA